MPPPLAEVGRRGRLDLRFSCKGGRTVLGDSYCEVPFKITRLQDSRLAGMAHLILMQSTAGLFGGDTVDLTIHVDSGARVLITQQSATKAHPSGGRLAVQTHAIRVDAGGDLRLYLEPMIPFANSQVRQRVAIELAAGARLRYWEGFMAGRVGRGEAWQFDGFDSETRLAAGGRLLYLERFCLVPKDRRVDSTWLSGGACYFGTGLCFDEQAGEFADRLHNVLPEAGVDVPELGLLAVRVAAAAGPEFHRSRAAFESLT